MKGQPIRSFYRRRENPLPRPSHLQGEWETRLAQRTSMNPDSIDFERLLRQTFVRSHQWYAQAESTNTLALEDLRDRSELPHLILTDLQTAGRGRGENKWWSTAGALTFTLVLERGHWSIPDARLSMLSLIVGLAAVRGVQNLLERDASDFRLQLKWPNDVYLNDRKLGGILIESLKHHHDRLAIGVGLNLNNSLTEASEAVRQRAISLYDTTDKNFSRSDLLIELFRELDSLGKLFALTPELVIDEYRNLCWLTGKHISVTNPHEIVSGTCLGINDTGALQLQTPSGLRRMVTGTIEV